MAPTIASNVHPVSQNVNNYVKRLPHSEFAAFVVQEDHKDLSSIQEICKGDAEEKQKIHFNKAVIVTTTETKFPSKHRGNL